MLQQKQRRKNERRRGTTRIVVCFGLFQSSIYHSTRGKFIKTKKSMFAVCVFRRFGLAVPVTLLLVGFLLQVTLDHKHGDGYYSKHSWTIGLSLFLTGIITGIISCIVDPPSTASSGYSSLLELSSDKIQEAGSNARETLDHFLTENSEEDQFCYIPLNRCSLALTVLGLVLICLDPFLSQDG